MNLNNIRTITITVDRPAYGGLAIGRQKGKVVMIRGAVLPGEIVELAVDSEKKDYFSASVLKILKPSSERITPFCGYFGKCGGCHFQHIPYPLQVKLKEEVLMDCLRRIGKIEANLSKPLVSGDPWNYRQRGQFKVRKGITGFYRSRSREIIDIEKCPLMSEKVNASFEKLRPLLNKTDIQELHIASGDCSIALVKSRSSGKSAYWNTLSRSFLKEGVSGLMVETDNGLFQYGTPVTVFDLMKLKYTLSPTSFFQSNWKMNNQVVKHIKESLRPFHIERILDLYAGSGNFSLPLSDLAEIVAVEENPSAIKDGMRNMKINKIKNCTFIHSPAENYQATGSYDVVILDPPRPGLTQTVMNNVLSILPERIVYLSCNPTTFARDLKSLLSRYDIESIKMIDFFPQTYHIEALAFLRLR